MVLIYMMIFCSALYLAKAFYNIVRAVILRAALYIRLSKICKKHGYEISRKRPFPASFFGFSRRPDMVIKTASAEYIVRLITCRARKRHYHFVSHEWFVRAFKVYMLLPFLQGDELTLFKHVKYIPPLDGEFTGLEKQVVLLFNPSPLEITFTARGSAREIASNGSDFDGWLIYNARAFAKILEGEAGMRGDLS